MVLARVLVLLVQGLMLQVLEQEQVQALVPMAPPPAEPMLA
jgi:hypothetical protein